jgi:glycosyltransferase involved in cell wall biosynthesis
MHIAIDASRTTVPNPTGTERYALELLRALIPLTAGQHRLTLYFRDAPAPNLFPAAPHVTHKVIPFRRVWSHVRFALALFADRPDVTFVPAHALPFVMPGRAVVTVHDLGYKLFPQAHPARARAYLDLTTRTSAARARVIVADSRATATDLTHFYGTPAAKIRVAYPGVTPPPVGDGTAARAKFGLPQRYFAYVGTLQPRKNIARLVRAFTQARAQVGDDLGLVLAGGKGWLYDPTWAEGVAGVTLTGYVTEAEKGALLRGALGLAFPSLYEGFGFPVVEAMGLGVPVLASNTSSLPELTDAHAVLVNPEDEADIAAGLVRLASDNALRARLSAAGGARAAQFSWAACAAQVLAALTEAAG